MRMRSRLAAFGALAGLTATLAAVTPAEDAYAHGAMTYPPTRSYICYVNGIEGGQGGNIAPTNPACQNLLAENGNYPFYNWFGNLISDAGGRHREIIPDGQLCGPHPQFSGLNLVSEHWPTTTLVAGSTITFQYNAWAPHPGTWYLYVTKDGWDPNSPLVGTTWSLFPSTRSPTRRSVLVAPRGRSTTGTPRCLTSRAATSSTRSGSAPTARRPSTTAPTWCSSAAATTAVRAVLSRTLRRPLLPAPRWLVP